MLVDWLHLIRTKSSQRVRSLSGNKRSKKQFSERWGEKNQAYPLDPRTRATLPSVRWCWSRKQPHPLEMSSSVLNPNTNTAKKEGFLRGSTISGISAKMEFWSSPKPKGGMGILKTRAFVNTWIETRFRFGIKEFPNTYGLYILRYKILTPEVYTNRESEQVTESLDTICVSHQFLNIVLFATATSNSEAGNESPNAQRTWKILIGCFLNLIGLSTYQRNWIDRRTPSTMGGSVVSKKRSPNILGLFFANQGWICPV